MQRSGGAYRRIALNITFHFSKFLKSWRLVSNNCNFSPLGIFLSGFKLSTKEIDEKLSVFREEDGALPMDQVIALKR